MTETILNFFFLIILIYLLWKKFREIELTKLDNYLRRLNIDWREEFEKFLKLNNASKKFDKTIQRQFLDYGNRYIKLFREPRITHILSDLIDFEEDTEFWNKLNEKWIENCKSISNLY